MEILLRSLGDGADRRFASGTRRDTAQSDSARSGHVKLLRNRTNLESIGSSKTGAEGNFSFVALIRDEFFLIGLEDIRDTTTPTSARRLVRKRGLPMSDLIGMGKQLWRKGKK